MNFILLTTVSRLIIVLSDITVLIFPSLGLIYHLECALEGLKYLPLATNLPDSMTFPPVVLFIERFMLKVSI